MAQNDAVSLLQKVSGCHGDGSVELVNLLERVPLAVARYGDTCTLTLACYVQEGS